MKYNVCFYAIAFITYLGCKRCGSGNKPASFVTADVLNQQESADKTGSDAPDLRTSRQFDNWFSAFARNENTDRNYPREQPPYRKVIYSFGINNPLHSILSKYFVNPRNSEEGDGSPVSAFIQPASPFSYPMPLLNSLLNLKNRKKIVIRIQSKGLSNTIPNDPAFSASLGYPSIPIHLSNLFLRNLVPPVRSIPVNIENFGQFNKNTNSEENLEKGFPSLRDIFSNIFNGNSVQSALNKVNVTYPTKAVFKHFIPHERNPCYSEYVNSSGVHYFYDVLRVFKYIHGYSGWSDDRKTEGKKENFEQNEIKDKLKSDETVVNNAKKNENDFTATNQKDDSSNASEKQNILVRDDQTPTPDIPLSVHNYGSADKDLSKTLNSEAKYFAKYQNNDQITNIKNAGVYRMENRVDTNEPNNPINNPFPTYIDHFQNMPKATQNVAHEIPQNKDEVDNNEQMKFGNVYANPDGSNDYLKRLRTKQETDGSHEDKFTIPGYVDPSQKLLLGELEKLEKDFENKMTLIRKYTNDYNSFKRDLSSVFAKQDKTVGNVYADPERD